MSKFVIILFVFLAVLLGDWIQMSGNELNHEPEIHLLKSDNEGILLSINTYGFYESDTFIDNINFKRVTIPGDPVDVNQNRTGKPQTPFIRLLIAVPDSCEFTLSANVNDNYTLYEDFTLYPIPKLIFEDDNSGTNSGYREEYCYDTLFYNNDTLYPDKFYEVITIGYWRDQRVIEVHIYPFQFNPAQELYYVYNSIDIEISYSGSVVINDKGLGPFEQMGRDILLNYPGVDRDPGPHPPPSVHYYDTLSTEDNIADYIVVSHDYFLLNDFCQYWINEFAQWRVAHNGFDVGIVSMTDVYDEFLDQGSADSAKALRDFLVYAYNNWQAPSMTDGHFAYCLFIGDWDYVPIETCYSGSNIPIANIPYLGADEAVFRDIDADTLNAWEDIMLGRWPVSNIYGELVVIAQKTINYEKYPKLGDWRRRSAQISADWDTFVDDALPYIYNISYDTLPIRWRDNWPQPPESLFADSVHKLMNMGQIITSFYDHSGPIGWNYNYGTWRAESLSNHDSLHVILSYSCNAAMFQFDHPYYDTLAGKIYGNDTMPMWWGWDTCFAECMLWNSEGGAVAFFGCTTPVASGAIWMEPLASILQRQNWIIGPALINHLVCSSHGDDRFCLLGDPALDIGDYSAYPDMPDLVIRPLGMDITLLDPYPYVNSNATIPIKAKAFNIGGDTAYNIVIRIIVMCDENIIFTQSFTIPSIQPLDTTVVVAQWNTGITHPNFTGEIGDCEIIARADPDDLIDESWEFNNTSSIIRKVALYPYESGWPLRVNQLSQPAIADIDNNSTVEIIYVGSDSVYVFNPDGSLYGNWPKCFDNVSSMVIGDINSDNYDEIIAVSENTITAYDRYGNVLNGWPKSIPYSDKRIMGYPALGYISGSRKRQIVVFVAPKNHFVSQQAKILVYNYNGNLLYDMNTSILTRVLRSEGPAISDLDNDGVNDIILSYTNDVENQREIGRIDVFNRYGLQQSFNFGGRTIPAIGYINTDANVDFVVGCADNHIRAYDYTYLQSIWDQSTEGIITSSIALGDIHPFVGGLNGVEAAFGNEASRIHLRERDQGLAIDPWPYEIIPNTMIGISPAITDANRDFIPDIIIGAANNYLYALNYEKALLSPFPLPMFRDFSSPIIGDIDGDQKSEMILCTGDYLHVLEIKNSRTSPYLLDWPQFHHDYQRTGLHGWTY
ncbi:hypothetical protein A2Y85_08355 [candidate division WOR-3 bacterium RBG_13_43_14]|uniref:Gingipain domain-containing protein n=1 Tax=candidate division WOR-3 bacterium RBG_13_43_14 TaxID=1802590 RepID=A0A1F4U2N9_UNCW3|nr:MAG: hypothetical protein A2Y85_08355 [candidate division WOR-3 bacterium RBG_13_43_14]